MTLYIRDYRSINQELKNILKKLAMQILLLRHAVVFPKNLLDVLPMNHFLTIDTYRNTTNEIKRNRQNYYERFHLYVHTDISI